MAIFFHDICLFGDEAGFGVYRQEHAYEHVQFVQMAQLGTPSKFALPDYDLRTWENTTGFARGWLTTHEIVHMQINSWLGTSSINLADVDLSKEDEFYQWLDAHRAAHVAIRAALGIV